MAIGTVTLNAAIDKLYVVDRLDPYRVSRVRQVINTAGGKGLNVARIVALAGERALAAGLLGGYNGMYFESLITEQAIEKRFTRVRGETRCCINLWDLEQSKSTEYLEPGAAVGEEELRLFLDDYRGVVRDSDVICISGSVPQGVPEDFCARLVELAAEGRKPVLVDTTGAQLRAAYGARPTMMKPNTDEIVQLMDVDAGSRESLVRATQEMYKDGIGIAAISLGADGVLITCGEGTFHAVPPRVQVVNTVGSGDSMMGGFAVGIARGYDMVETMRFACAVATANTLSMNTGSYRKEDLDALLPLVTVNQLA